MTVELNIDGLIGPTHNYAGLSFGNIASHKNKGVISNPRSAALQGLNKVRTLINLGVPQAIMPPHERPFLPLLKQLGFQGRLQNIVTNAWATSPELMANLCSASSMWTANAATVSAGLNCHDRKVHLTPANLAAMPHRSIEPATTRRMLKTIFRNDEFFEIHEPLPSNRLFGDEGAANHNVLSHLDRTRGLEVFVYGQHGLRPDDRKTKFPGRQTREASEAIARSHGLSPDSVMFVEQSAAAIDAGAFHNDVVCVMNGPVVFYHEEAFSRSDEFRTQLITKADKLEFTPIFLEASSDELSLRDAVRSYVFNSQVVTLEDGTMAIILPSEVAETPAAFNFVQKCIEANNPLSQAIYVDIRESMQNGGGPACLRLRVPLTQTELAEVHGPIIMDNAKLDHLESWVNRHYRDRLSPNDLADPQLVTETQCALDELTQILKIGSFYDFQYNEEPHWSEYE